MNDRSQMLLEVVSDSIRRKHYPDRTEKSYLQWIKRYVIKNAILAKWEKHKSKHRSPFGSTIPNSE